MSCSVTVPFAGVRLVDASSRRRLEDVREVVEFLEESELSREGPGLVVLVLSPRRRVGSAERRLAEAACAEAASEERRAVTSLPRGSAAGAVLVLRLVLRTCSRGDEERLLSSSLCTVFMVQFPQASAGSWCV